MAAHVKGHVMSEENSSEILTGHRRIQQRIDPETNGKNILHVSN